MLRIAVLACVTTGLLACATRNPGDGVPYDAGPSADGAADATADAAGDTGPADAGPGTDFGPTPDDTVVYAHSSHTLYGFDPRTNMVARIGDFTFLDGTMTPSMTDLAVDSTNTIYTCSRDQLFRVDHLTAVATVVAALTVPGGAQLNGLTFVPAGVLDPTHEVLVGASDAGDYFTVDTTTGTATLRGTFMDGFGESGDIVSVAGAGTFTTVKRSDLVTDHLVMLDPATGATTDLGDVGVAGVFGLGYWRSKLYGFTRDGALIRIDIHTGAGTTVTTATGAAQFYGAGVTTLAPTLI